MASTPFTKPRAAKRKQDHDDVHVRAVACEDCGKVLASALKHSNHIFQCRSRRSRLSQEATQHMADDEQRDEDALLQPCVDDELGYNEEMLRLFTSHRVYNMSDADIQRFKGGIPTILAAFKKAAQAHFDTHPTCNDLEEAFDQAGSVLQGLQTSLAERNKARQHYKPVKPKVRVLGKTVGIKPTTYGEKQIELEDIVVENLVEECLEELVCTPQLAVEFFQDKRSKDPDEILDVHDGTLFRKHPLFSHYPTAVAFGFYGDDFEVHIAIGPAAGERKVSLHYAVCYNLPKTVRFSINNLILVSAVYTKDVKKYGCKQVIDKCSFVHAYALQDV
jgi:hypothetical protein